MNMFVDSVTHTFNDGVPRDALVDVSFDVGAGRFVAIVGPSGCGKSTLLRLIANLLTPSHGHIGLDGQAPARMQAERRIAWMAQSPALLPWLTVRANVDLALRFHSPDRLPRLTTTEALDLVRLSDVSEAYPHTLSGGMQQRLALARLLVMDAALWLMDEPFSSLDELSRERLTGELVHLWEPLRPTVLWVTHHIYEALRLADRVLVFSSSPGRLVADLAVDFPRPRIEAGPEFQALLRELRSILEETEDDVVQ